MKRELVRREQGSGGLRREGVFSHCNIKNINDSLENLYTTHKPLTFTISKSRLKILSTTQVGFELYKLDNGTPN